MRGRDVMRQTMRLMLMMYSYCHLMQAMVLMVMGCLEEWAVMCMVMVREVLVMVVSKSDVSDGQLRR